MMMAIIHCDNGCSVNHVHTLFFVRKIGFQQSFYLLAAISIVLQSNRKNANKFTFPLTYHFTPQQWFTFMFIRVIYLYVL